MKIFSFSN